MRSVCLAFLCISVTGVSLVAADRVPSAVRARQIPAGSQFRNVQDSQPPRTYAEDEAGPNLGEPAPSSRDERPFGERQSVPDASPASPAAPVESLQSPETVGPAFPVNPNPRPEPTFDPTLSEPELGPSRATIPFTPGPTPSVAARPGTTAARDFWIVSSRQCPQTGTRPCLTCGLGYFQCNRGGRPARSDEGTFQRSIQPGVPVCIVVHGSFTDWETVCDDACATNRWLHAAAPHLPMQMIFYSWPSDPQTRVLPPLDIEVMGTRAGFNGIYLSLLVQRIPKDCPICMIGHSHGARAISASLHLLGGGDIQGYRYQNVQAIPHRIRTVFMAGAIDHHWLTPGERYGNAMARTEALLNVKNSQDWALGFYSWRGPFSGTAVGREGLSTRDLRGLGAYASRVRELDVAPLIHEEHLWPGYVKRPEIATAAVPYVYFVDDPAASGAPAGVVPGAIPAEQAARQMPGAGYVQRYQASPDPRRTVSPNPDPRYSTSPYAGYAAGRPAASSYPPANTYPASNGYPPANTASPAGVQPAGSYGTVGNTARPPAAAPGYTSPWGQQTSTPATNSYYPPTTSYTPSSPLRPLPGGAAPARPVPAGTPAALPQRAPATLGLPETTSNAPRPLDGTSVTRTTAPNANPGPGSGSSLQPIERPRIESLPSSEESHPVNIEQKAFDRPKTKLPSILRRYYPEASRDSAEPAVRATGVE